MASSYWDESLAARYRAFQYSFPERSLAGRVLILAGGTGGLGAAATMLLAREGAKLVVGFRSNRARAEALRAAVASQTGVAISLVEGDIVLPEVRRAYLDAAANLGPIEGGVIFPGDPARVNWEALDGAALRNSWDANFAGPVLLAKDLAEAIERNGRGGSLVLLATMQAVAPFASSLNYAAPKAALVHAARILAKQFRDVRVNVVAPGATVAGMAEASVSSGKYDAYVSSGAISRFGRPEDVARAVRFFLEPDGYVTGQVLLADGGLTLRRDQG
jgi:NAD(P)-dependent dehydrogenase (short-subunit alcohol dehydrogenase family)